MRQVLEGKVAIVTGASSGIGAASAKALAAAGASVVLAARGQEQGQSVAQIIEDDGGNSIFVQTDVTKEADVQSLIDQTLSEFGGLDIAFNNAGIEGSGLYPLTEDNEDNFDRIQSVNVKGVW